MRRTAILALILVAHPAWAKKGSKADRDEDDDSSAKDDADADDSSDDEDAPKKKKPAKSDEDSEKPDKSSEASSDDETTDSGLKKQDLTGHDLGSKKKTTTFERDRFFVDKVDTDETRDATLIQGSLTWSNVLFTEAGGNYPVAMGATTTPNSDAAAFSRYYTDLRLQTDFRHIKGSRWDARVDGRIRFVDTPAPTTAATATTYVPSQPLTVQSGLTGQNEYELRELWLVRNGERTDVIIGRQFIPDLAAVKIDGVRIDYASSTKLTLLGFGGLYPLRGSRSLSTDYIDLKYTDGSSAGQFVGAGGFGGAYRTSNAYGAVGGVVLLPLEKESARVFGTSNGYWRYGSTIDIYHYAVVDLIGNNDALGAGHAGLTNLSAGVNYKPNPRLRMTASYNRVDTETLNVQANAFLTQPQPGSIIQNEVFIARLATNQLRGSISGGLGELQRFEVTVAASYRSRPAFDLTSPDATQKVGIPGEVGADVYGSITDRHSIKDARLGLDFAQTFGIGAVPYQRSDVTALRAFASHSVKDGQGEWEAEISYAQTQDRATAGMCIGGAGPAAGQDVRSCFGSTNGSVLSIGGSLYYRFNRDWFGIASAYISRTDLAVVTPSMTTGAPPMSVPDPTITGLTGFARISYRF